MKPIPTVTIRRNDMNVRINASDYDEARDGSLVEGDAPGTDPVIPGTNQPAATVGAVSAPQGGAVVPEGDVPPVTSPEAVSAGPVAAAVVKKGRKFIVTDAQGNPVTAEGIDAGGYANESDAWAAIMKANAK